MMEQVSIGDMTLNAVCRGHGSPLLLVHGFPLDHSMWRGQIEPLSDTFRVIAPDLRGFGKSRVEVGEILTMEQFADDLARLLDALEVSEPITFCGLSMGGYIGWQFLERHGERLEKLILCDTKAAADGPNVLAARRETAERVLRDGPDFLAEVMAERLFAEKTLSRQPEVVAATQEVIRRADPQAIAAALRGMAARVDMQSRLPSIRVPTLLVVGQHDIITPAKGMQSMASAMPHARFLRVADAGHMAPLEQPVEVNAAIRDFAGRTSRAR